jgi:hypothetical protein
MQTSALIPVEKDQGSSKVATGLAKLILTLLETLRELMERQARHRMKEGSLSDDQVEKLGLAFMQLKEKTSEIASLFNLDRKDLSLGLATYQPGSSRTIGDSQTLSLVDLLDRVVEKGVVVFGDLGISVAEVELINVQLRLVVNAVRDREPRGKRVKRIRKISGRNHKRSSGNADLNQSGIQVRHAK